MAPAQNRTLLMQPYADVLCKLCGLESVLLIAIAQRLGAAHRELLLLMVWIPAGERHRESVLQNIAVNLESWTVQTKQETAIYHTLNKLSVDTSRKVTHLPLLLIHLL